jgi:hypothetical protein
MKQKGMVEDKHKNQNQMKEEKEFHEIPQNWLPLRRPVSTKSTFCTWKPSVNIIIFLKIPPITKHNQILYGLFEKFPAFHWE